MGHGYTLILTSPLLQSADLLHMKNPIAKLPWKKDSVLESKVSVLQGEIRQLKWAMFGAFSENAKLQAALEANEIEIPRAQKRGD